MERSRRAGRLFRRSRLLTARTPPMPTSRLMVVLLLVHLQAPVTHAAWVRNPIDRFILARLEKQSIRPSPEADKVTLARRLYLYLLGLPPSLGELDAFLADARPDAYERLVDHLLASPHYGERW